MIITKQIGDAVADLCTALVASFARCWNGATWDRMRTPATFKDATTIPQGSMVAAWIPASSKTVRFMGGSVSVDVAGTSLLFEDNVTNAFVWRTPKLAANTPHSFDLGNGKQLGAAGNVLQVTPSQICAVTGTYYGTEEA